MTANTWLDKLAPMQTYLVGGAVRDELLNYPVHERDWVVVGGTPEAMLDRGYTQVGRDFPVFLHPETKEEYALARTERKSGHGYTGFEVHYAPNVTLEEDLARRDLTINAIARAPSGELIDPYGGQRDIEDRVLRHVSSAFIEDPLRVLRVARFAARYHHLGFAVAPETIALMLQITRDGELGYLPPERLWQEMQRALGERNPDVFIHVLRSCGALAALLPELNVLFGVPQSAEHHPEIDTGVHTLMALQRAADLDAGNDVRFAVLVHDLGKGTSPRAEWPRHIEHEVRGVTLVDGVCDRLKVPNHYRSLALSVCRYHLHAHRGMELRGKTLLNMLESIGALRQADNLTPFLLACQADSQGRKGYETRPYPQADYLQGALAVIKAITAAPFKAEGLEGRAIGDAMRVARIRALDDYREAYRSG